jgi:cell division septum initiation protein DivIVA
MTQKKAKKNIPHPSKHLGAHPSQHQCAHLGEHLGEEFTETLDKIEPAIAQLHEATRTIHEQVESLKSFSQSAQEQIQSSLKESIKTVAETVTKEITSAAEKQLHEILQPLERSSQYALRALHDTKFRKRLRMAGFFCLSCLVTGLVGFGTGYMWKQKQEIPRILPKEYSNERVKKLPSVGDTSIGKTARIVEKKSKKS